MSIANARSIKTAQLKMRELQIIVDGTAGTPSASGHDKLQISQVVDNGVGDYTIILKRPFNAVNKSKAMAFVQSITADRVAAVVAVAHDRVTVNVTDLSGVAADADLMILIKGSDARIAQ